MATKTEPERTNLQISLENLRPEDARFLAGLVEIFTDPHRAKELRALRNGYGAVSYAPTGAEVHRWDRVIHGTN